MLPIYVISVGVQSERRRDAARQLQAQGLTFEFFDGYDGDAGRDCFAAVDLRRFLLNTGKLPRDGEIGCYASHKALWQRCVELRRPVMIMEDDFRLAREFPAACRCVESLIDCVEYLRLQDERRARSVRVMTVGDFALHRYTKMPHCTMCYALTPRIAARLLAMSGEFCAPVDVVMKRVWQIGQPLYCLTPYTVSDGSHCRDSVIGTRRRCRKPLRLRAQRTAVKLGWRLAQWHFNLRHSDRRLKRSVAALDLDDTAAFETGPQPTA